MLVEMVTQPGQFFHLAKLRRVDHLVEFVGEGVIVEPVAFQATAPVAAAAARKILDDIAGGRFRSVPDWLDHGLNIISCPSCSRVENDAFVELAQRVKKMTAYARDHDVTIAIMGCRVNGPGETDDADLGLWCGPAAVNLKRGREVLGAYRYDEVLDRLRAALDELIGERVAAT